MDRKIPVHKELIEHLENVYKDQAPILTDTVDAIRFHSGRVAVVRYIRKLFTDQFTPPESDN